MAKNTTKGAQVELRETRKVRLGVEVPPDLRRQVRDLSAYLKAEGYKASQAELVERWCRKGIEDTMRQFGLDEIPKQEKRKPLPATKAKTTKKKRRR